MKNIKNISLLRQQMSPTRPTPPVQIPQQIMNLKAEQNEVHEPKIEIELDEEMPTDLSMVQNQNQVQVQPTDLSLSIKNNIQESVYHSLKLERNDEKK